MTDVSFWDMLKPAPAGKSHSAAKAPTAAELRAALAEAEAAAEAAERLAAEVAEERAGLLLAADEATLDEVDRRLQLSQRSADKAAAAVAALETRLAEAVEAERVAGLDRLHAEGAEALDDGLAAYASYGELAPRIVSLADRMLRARAAIERANEALGQAGDPRRLADLEATARPRASCGGYPAAALWSVLRLPHPVEPLNLLYPANIDVNGMPVTAPQSYVPPQRGPSEGEPKPPRQWSRW